jgi:DNA-binding NtrC family response regulator
MPVLLIDDDEDLRLLMAEYLTSCGKKVRACGSIAEARAAFAEMARTEPPHTVIVDDQLPDGKGIGFCRSLQPAFPGTRWILISGNHDLDALAQAKAEGATFISVDKPMSLRTLNALAS